MTNLNNFTISEARDKLKSKEISSLELTNSCLSAIDAADALGAFVHKTPELAIEQAKRADERLQKENAPDLCGIPLGIKDLFCTEGVESQAASRIYWKISNLNMKVLLARTFLIMGRLCWVNLTWMSLPWVAPMKPPYMEMLSILGKLMTVD